MQPDGSHQVDKMADAKCSELEMPADEVSEIDKMRDRIKQMRWNPQIRRKYGR